MEGQIIKIISNTYTVSCDREIIDCKCRGRIKNEKIIPVVGDYVIFDKDKKIIENVLPRKNSFNRPLVSNIDQAFIVTSLKEPDLSLNLLDKLIVLMEINNVQPIICITKEDLLKDEEKDIKKYIDYYRKIGYIVVYNYEIDKIKDLLKNKSSVFTGQTGAGKSTLLNRLNQELKLKTGEVSKALGRGKHTTRVVELFSFCGGKVLDTPGFSALDLTKYTKEQIRDAFIEFKNFSCIYKDCMHVGEKECKVKKAVNDNNILEERYNDYLKFLERK